MGTETQSEQEVNAIAFDLPMGAILTLGGWSGKHSIRHIGNGRFVTELGETPLVMEVLGTKNTGEVELYALRFCWDDVIAAETSYRGLTLGIMSDDPAERGATDEQLIALGHKMGFGEEMERVKEAALRNDASQA